MQRYRMTRLLICSLFLFGLLLQERGLAAEKLRLGTPAKEVPLQNLPPTVAEEKGFWKEAGLEVEFTAFRGGSEMHRAVAAGAIDLGLTMASSVIIAVSRGIPELIVADFRAGQDFFFMVRPDSPIKKPEDLKGAKFGVNLASTTHAYGRAVVRKLGLEREVKFVGVGGLPAQVAALKRGFVDVVILGLTGIVWRTQGVARDVLFVGDYLPKPWAELILYATKELTEKKAQSLVRAIKALGAATAFIRASPDWSVVAIVSQYKYSEEAAREIYKRLSYSKNLDIDLAALENVRSFLIEHGIVSKEDAPLLASMVGHEFVQKAVR